MTLADFAASAVPVSPLNGNTQWANRYARELREIVNETSRRAPRSVQKHLGPSELGVECDRQVVGKMAGVPGTNHVMDVWPSVVGTACHLWMAEAMAKRNVEHGLRYLIETRVHPYSEHSGTGDLYDAREQAVVDYKFLGPTTLDYIVRHGPTRKYYVQLLLYALGFVRMGLPVRRVVLAAFPRTKSRLDEMYVWEVEVFSQDQLDLLQIVFADTERRKKLADEIVAGRRFLDSIPATPDDHECFFCPFYRPEAAHNPSVVGCSGKN